MAATSRDSSVVEPFAERDPVAALMGGVLERGGSTRTINTRGSSARQDGSLEVYPGAPVDSMIDSVPDGTTVRLHAGEYPRITVRRSFQIETTIEGEPGTRVAGFTVSGGNLRVQALETTDENRVEDGSRDVVFDSIIATAATGIHGGPSVWYIRGDVRRVRIENSAGRGGWDVVKVFAPPPARAHDVVLRGNDLSGAWEDMIHVDGATDMIIAQNLIHDPLESPEHNDGVQSQHSTNLRIVRNTFTWPAATGHGPNQAIMLGAVPQWPERKVVATYIGNNIVHHWAGGRPLIMNGTEGTRIVNNTLQDSGDRISVTVANQGSEPWGQNTGLEIWNNILQSVYIDEGSTWPSLFTNNLFTDVIPRFRGTRSIVKNPRFVDRESYMIDRRSPARRSGVSRVGTPKRTIAGVRRPFLPAIGAHE